MCSISLNLRAVGRTLSLGSYRQEQSNSPVSPVASLFVIIGRPHATQSCRVRLPRYVFCTPDGVTGRTANSTRTAVCPSSPHDSHPPELFSLPIRTYHQRSYTMNHCSRGFLGFTASLLLSSCAFLPVSTVAQTSSKSDQWIHVRVESKDSKGY